MSLISKASGNDTPRELIPAGMHLAVCVAVADFGTQQTKYKGKPKEVEQVNISWELPEIIAEYEHNNETIRAPRVKGEIYTNSLGSKAKLRKMLEGWRGRPFTEQELEGFDLKKLLGVPALLNITHNAANNGNTYDNISTVTPLMKGQQAPPPTYTYMYDISQGESFPEKMPEWMQECIQKSKELGGFTEVPQTGRAAQQQQQVLTAPGQSAEDYVNQVPPPPAPLPEESVDDIPF
jgi:hypothetical protein